MIQTFISLLIYLCITKIFILFVYMCVFVCVCVCVCICVTQQKQYIIGRFLLV